MSTTESPAGPKTALLIVWRIIVVAAILTGGILLMQRLAGLKKPPEQMTVETIVPLVSTVTLNKRLQPVVLSGFGLVRSGRSAVVAPEVSGRIIWKADLNSGDAVAADAPLIRIDDRDYHVSLAATQARSASVQAEIKQWQAQLSAAKNILDQRRERATISQTEADRLKRLFRDKKIGTQSATDAAARAALIDAEAISATEELIAVLPHRITAAEATLRQLKAQAELDDLRIARCEIRSPFAGRIESFTPEFGAFLSPGVPILTIADDTDREIAVALRADQISTHLPFADSVANASGGWFSVPKPIEVDVRDPADANGSSGWKGTVERVSSINPKTRMAELVIRPKNDATSRPLPVGTFCEVRIPGNSTTAFAIPRSALRTDQNVFVVDNGKLVVRRVEVIHVDGDVLLVLGELENGTQLITSRLTAPLSGMDVRVNKDNEQQ